MADEHNRRKELVSAAKGGVLRFLETTRGAAIFGSGVRVQDFGTGFVVITSDDGRVYFDTTEM